MRDFIGYFSSLGVNHAMILMCVDILPCDYFTRKETRLSEKKETQSKGLNYSSLSFYMEEKTHFVGSSDSDIEDLSKSPSDQPAGFFTSAFCAI